MTVWIVNADKHDTSPAAVWGDIRHINTRYVYGDEIEGERMPASALLNISHAADQFDPDRDLVLIGGDHLQLVAFMRLLGERYGAQPIRVLRYDKKVTGYIPVWV